MSNRKQVYQDGSKACYVILNNKQRFRFLSSWLQCQI